MYGKVPPPGVTVAEPFEPPKQLTGAVWAAVAVKSVAWMIVTVAIAVQLFASVTVTE